ncbi:conserved protein of unknown function [Nitrospira japonica]|uniref:DUF72 domain-containing protein n=1 Tax=Nitrospira japonica TaxID=1325564 RepID=A0A1W1IAH5_9BACT|nr:DUF72 domain-containing protein [Nitrospira japonica]SLM49879.1 conserved protein of unknown function [Nitrospira japonica]
MGDKMRTVRHRRESGRILVGTSGWTYGSWKGLFYPVGLPNARWLEFFTGQFPTTEVNYSFYHLPKPSTYEKWASQVPQDFIFSVKASRYITHVKRLKDVEDPWRLFLSHARSLGTHLGPILFQFPESFHRDDDRLKDFLEMVRRGSSRLRLVCEFRHESWFSTGVYRLLNRLGAALCIGDSGRYPRRDVVTADFAYVRFHGRSRLFASNYTRRELDEEARKVKGYLRDGYDAYVYFNNDAEGHAVANAKTFMGLIEKPSVRAR